MIKSPRQLKDKIKNLSGNDNQKAHFNQQLNKSIHESEYQTV